MKNLFAAGFAILAAAAVAPALANDAMPLPADATPEEAAAYAVLDKHCARCHQDGALKDGLTSAKSGFGFVLDVRRLAQDTKFVTQGDHFGSKLYDVIGPYSFPSMPDDCADPACYPTDDDLAAISGWIDALGQAPPPPRPFISLADMYAAAAQDLQAQPTNRRDRVRYLSLRELHNDQTVSDENLAGYLAATVKLLNALSWNPNVYVAEPVGGSTALLRVFLPDIGWTPQKWALLEAIYPYGMHSDTDPYLGTLRDMAATPIPVIRADWLAARAPVSPLYYDLLDLPDTVQGLEALLGLDMAANILNEQVVRAGFQDSGVSTNNRLIERHPLASGFFGPPTNSPAVRNGKASWNIPWARPASSAPNTRSSMTAANRSLPCPTAFTPTT